MPATYAHFRFGRQVRQNIEADKLAVIDRYPQLYHIGLHGPDILFYYNAILSNPVNQTGFALHEVSGMQFFQEMTEVVRAHGDEDAYLAYVYGVLTHFVLDASCHAYVESRVRDCGISHTETEVEFDRFLMEKDHKDPQTNLTSMHIVPSAENAQVIAAFYDGISETQLQKALRDMILCHKVLLPKNNAKRALLYGCLRLAGKYDTLKDQVMTAEANPACMDSNQKLYQLYYNAIGLAAKVINAYDPASPEIIDKEAIFQYTFSGEFAGTLDKK